MKTRNTVRTLFAGAVVLVLLAGGLQAADLASQIDAMIKPHFPAGRPGLAIIVTQNGQVLFRKAYGSANLELGVPLRPDMLFRIGSMTKQFTAAAVMKLVEAGKISLSDPITKFLPDYPVQGHVITVEHLLTHTSGIQNYTAIPGWMTSKVLADLKLDELINGFKNEPMRFAPGTRYEYSNSNYILLGAIIEKASGEAYESFLEKNIFDPLGMTSTLYGHNQPLIPNRAGGYDADGDTVLNASYLSMTQPHAAGALLSTVDDLAKWDAALYTEKVLKQESLKRMWTPYTLKDGTPSNYGFGWAMRTLRGSPTVQHNGGINGFVSDGVRLPQEKVYVAVLCNTTSPALDPGLLSRKVAALVIGKPFPERKAIPLAPEILTRYAGVYKINDSSQRTVIVENGKLYTQRSGGPRMEAFPYSETEFFYAESLSNFRFVLGPDGKVSEMWMYQDGSDTPEKAARIGDAPTLREIKLDPATYDRYAGDYELAPGFVLTVSRKGDKLMIKATGQGEVEVFPESETSFFVKEIDARITFVLGPDGKAASLVLHQGGRDMPGKKIK